MGSTTWSSGPERPVLSGATRLCELIAADPECLPVLLRHGLQLSGAPLDSEWRLSQFAEERGLDVDELLALLEAARCDQDPPAPTVRPGGSPLPYFLVAGLIATFTGGSFLGAVNQLRMQYGLREVSSRVKELHADFQLMGLIALVIGGLALEVLPRLWKVPRPGPRLPDALMGLLVLSLALHSTALWTSSGWAVAAGLASGLAGVLFAAWVIASWRRSRKPWSAVDALILGGSVWWPVGKLLWLLGDWPRPSAYHLAHGVAAGERSLVMGFTLCWIVALLAQVHPHLCGLGDASSRKAWAIVLLANLGVTLHVMGLALLGPSATASLGLVVLAGALGLLVTSAAWPARSARTGGGQSRPVSVFLALGLPLIWAALAALGLAIGAVQELAGLGSPPRLLMDVARHSLGAGFSLGALVAASMLLLPAMTGRPLAFPAMLWAGLIAFHLGMLARWVHVASSASDPGRVSLFGWFGFLLLLGLVPWAANLIAGVRTPVRPTSATG
jgi:hypothetical protein